MGNIGNIGTIGNIGNIGSIGSIGSLGSIGSIESIGSLRSLGSIGILKEKEEKEKLEKEKERKEKERREREKLQIEKEMERMERERQKKERKKDGEMEMLIKYINDNSAIWTFGYPFMNQFLMIFNMEDNHVGIKKLKKTALPIVDLYKDWERWNLKHEKSLFFKVVAIIVLILIVIVILFLIYRAIRKRSLDSNGPAFDVGDHKPIVY